MDKRTSWPDYAKAIGIVLVVYGHVARGIHHAGIECPERWYRVVDSVVYSFHMPLFFFLSGLFFRPSLAKRGSQGLLLSKIDTILYPYVVWSLLQGCVEAGLSQVTNGDVSFQEVFALFWAPRAQFWFLYALLLMFVACTLIDAVVPRRYDFVALVLAGVLYLAPNLLPDATAANLIAQNLVFFYAGMLFSEHVAIEAISTPAAAWGLAVSCGVGQWLLHGPLALESAGRGPASLLLALVSILFVVAVAQQLAQRGSRSLEFLGASSMAIYVMHVMAGSGVRIALSKGLHVDSALVHLVVGCLAGLAAPLLAIRLFDQLNFPYALSAPVSQWLRFGGNRARRPISVDC